MMNPHDASAAAYENRDAVERADEVSCYYCLRSYDPNLIERWTDAGETACCPHCDVDAVVPGRLSMYELRGLHEYWFTGQAQ
jgi:hypothetical protein